MNYGLKDPDRIKKLLGKTAQLNFRLVSESSDFGTDELISEDGELIKISKRIIMSGKFNWCSAKHSKSKQRTDRFI